MQEIIDKIKSDPFARFLGVEVEAAEHGYARCGITIQEHMLNFGGTPHGGLLFSLADVAFSLVACSEYMPSVALSVTGNYFKTAKVGARVVAEARPVASSRKFSTFAIEVRSDDELLASFSGTAYKIPRKEP